MADRNLLKKKVNELSDLKSIVSKSKMTEEDALELGRKVNKSLQKIQNFKRRGKCSSLLMPNVVFSVHIKGGK